MLPKKRLSNVFNRYSIKVLIFTKFKIYIFYLWLLLMKIKFLDLHTNIINIKEEINKKMSRVITNTSFIMGPELKDFEINFAKYNNSKYCLGVGNGTDALEIAIKSLDLPQDSEILTQSNTFVATCLGILNNNYKLRLVDCFETNFMMDYTKIEEKITPKTKVIIVVHLYGHSANMDNIMEIAKKYNLFVIEDCAQAHGCSYKNQKVGTFGDIGCFSFYPGKNLGAFGDAGGVITNNENLYNKMKLIRNFFKQKTEHFISKKKVL